MPTTNVSAVETAAKFLILRSIPFIFFYFFTTKG